MSDDNVTKLGVRFKEPTPPERTLVFPHEVGIRGCNHAEYEGAAFIVDDKLDEVTCSKCQAKLNPMFVLKQLTGRETRFHEGHRRYHDEMKRLKDRTRTKCEHCDRMTRISRR